MAVLGGILIGFVLAALTGLVLLANGYDLRPKSLKFLFMDVDASRFIDLSPARVFRNLSRAVISRSVLAEDWLTREALKPEPLSLIYLGWQLVCDTFLDRFGEYPSENNVQSHANELGGQNVEFILYTRTSMNPLQKTRARSQ